VVGNAGFVGAVLIIFLAKTVTICTGLSMAAMTTNIKIGAGGAYSIISKSLGLEAGGSIGISLYIAQTLSAALYIIGFTQGWLRVFPDHTPVVVSSVAWITLLVISYISAQLAIRIQYLIMTIIGVSILSFFLSPAHPIPDLPVLGNFEDAGFWRVFAVFFPAVTGIMAGANLSGDLKNPRRAIPLGTISAIIVTMIIYLALAYLISRIATPEELRTNQLIMVDRALWGQAVIAGIMGATLSSALGSMLGAPRILQALAEQKTVPFSKILAVKTATNEPRNAIIFTGILIELGLLVGNLDFLASLITMFFLITYGMLNLVVFLQQTMKIISFRPTLKIPPFIPLLGALQCIFIMFLINPLFSAVAMTSIVIMYVWLAHKGLEAKWGDIRGGLLLYAVERIAKVAQRFPRHQISWKPDLLLPIEEPETWTGPLLLIRSIIYPSGSVFAFTMRKEKAEETQGALDDLLLPLKEQGALVTSTVIRESDFLHGATLVIQILKSRTLRPNILFLTLGRDNKKDNTVSELISQASKHDMGVMILSQHPRMAFGMQKDVNLWLRDKSPNWHLALLIALQLQLNWEGKINLITTTSEKKDKRRLQGFLDRVSDRARLPSAADLHVLVGSFKESLKVAPRADINVFGLAAGNIPYGQIREVTDLTKSSCLFIKDSGQESALV
jgi:amino acid transporter